MLLVCYQMDEGYRDRVTAARMSPGAISWNVEDRVLLSCHEPDERQWQVESYHCIPSGKDQLRSVDDMITVLYFGSLCNCGPQPTHDVTHALHKMCEHDFFVLIQVVPRPHPTTHNGFSH